MKRHSSFLRLFLGKRPPKPVYRLWGPLLLVVGLFIVLGGYVFYRYVSADYLSGLHAQQRTDAAIIRQFFERDWPLEPPQIDRICKQLGQGAGGEGRMRVTFIAGDGTVLGDSDADPAHMDNHRTPDRPELLEALEGREGHSVRTSWTLGADLSYLAEPVRHGDQIVGAVRLAIPVKVIAERQRLTRHVLAWFALAAAALAVVLALLLAWIWYAPLKHLTLAAGQIASGDLSLRVRARGPKEFARLGEALNQMRQSLSRQIELIENHGRDLQTVIANLDEGVVALDAQGRIVLMNRAAGELLGTDHAAAAGQRLQSVVSRPIVVDAYNRAVSGVGDPTARYVGLWGPRPPTCCQMEIERDGQRRIVQLQAAAVAGGKGVPKAGVSALGAPSQTGERPSYHSRLGCAQGATGGTPVLQKRLGEVSNPDVSGLEPRSPIAGLLVFRDVTELARTAGVKAEFVANASHELRTPLATIRAAVDSLASVGTDDAEAFRKFVTILDRQASRLEELTNDLLNLHLLERRESALSPSQVSLRELADWALGSFSASAQEKGLKLDVSVPGDVAFNTDRKLLEMILQNLLDNALKFTGVPKGAPKPDGVPKPSTSGLGVPVPGLGTPGVSALGAPPAGGKVELSMRRRDDGIHFVVSDTGCGISQEDQPRVFERFFQADAARSGDARTRGTGLGLAIVKHAAERLGAKVTLASELGHGTTITVVLPVR